VKAAASSGKVQWLIVNQQTKARGELEYTSFITFMIVMEQTRHALSFTAILNTKKRKRIMTIACAHQASQILFY
jgi:hypothetical protein